MKPEIMKIDFKQQTEKPDTLELYIYSEVVPDGWDGWNWETGEKIESETSADFFRRKLSEYKDIKYINLYINSPGGFVREGYGIFAQLKRHEAYKTVYIDGFANSVASIIAMCGDHIIMYTNSIMGLHNMEDWLFGNAAEHRQMADNLDQMMEGNRQVYLERSGGKITLEKLTELLDAETFLTAQECLGYGFCDEVASTAADPAKVAQAVQRLNASTASQIKYFQMLKQSFDAAMDVLGAKAKEKTPPAEPVPDPPKEPVPDPKEPVPDPPKEPVLDPPKELAEPEQNKPMKFLNALILGGKEAK